MKMLLFLIMLIFAVFGFSEFLHILKLRIIFPKRKMYSHLVINLQNDIAERQLLFACEQYKWYRSDFADFILLSCENLDEETYIRCSEIAKKYNVKYPKRI